MIGFWGEAAKGEAAGWRRLEEGRGRLVNWYSSRQLLGPLSPLVAVQCAKESGGVSRQARKSEVGQQANSAGTVQA